MDDQWVIKGHILGQKMCYNPEGWGPYSAIREPDFTPCFEDTVILLIPSIYVFIAGSIRIWNLSKRPSLSKDFTRNWLYFIKMTTLLILLFLSMANLLFSIQEAFAIIDNAQILAQGFNVFILVFVMILHHLEYTRNKVSSGVLLFYWLFDIIVGSIKLRTMIISHGETGNHPDHFAMYLIKYALSVIIFILENVSRPKSQYIILEEDEMVCPIEKTNIFGRLTFSWMTPLMQLGYKSPLVMDDLWNLRHDDETAVISQKFQKNWNKELQKEKPSLFRALFKTLGGRFMFAALFKAIQDILQFLQPILLKELMGWVGSYLTDNPEPSYKGVFIAVFMFITAFTQTMFLHQYFHLCFTTGMRIRAALVTAIYQKTLVLSNASRQQSTVGEIVNRMSVDAQRLMDLCTNFHISWSGPFQIIIALYLLRKTMGPSIWAGVTVLVLAVPMNMLIAKTMRKYQKIQMGNKDARVKLMNEILNGIKVIKLYAWETPFIEKVNFIRNDLELTMLKKIGLLAAMQTFTWTSIPFFVSILTFAVYVFTSSTPLTSQIAFVAISLFGLLQFPMAIFPNVITSIIEASVSLYRIEDYLSSEEIDPLAIKREDFRKMSNWNPSIPLVEVRQADFKWNKHDSKTDLTNINLDVKKGHLTAIVGRVGSGKSTLISAILGDNVKVAGDVTLRGSIAYVPQQPWIMNATLRDNIVFGLRWDPNFYDQVLEACSLKPDLKVLANGDLTEIGERGINLSGGQKARISLARALYARADIYLLDDPLSAVDAHVGRHLFDHVIGPNGLLKNKARLLVTHAIAYLDKVDQVVMLRNGKIEMKGTYDELMEEEGSELYKLVREFGNQLPKEELGIMDNDDTTATSSVVDEEALEAMEGELSASLGHCEEEASINRDMMRRHANERRVSLSSLISEVSTLRRGSIASSIFKSQRNGRGGHVSRTAGQLITEEKSAQGKVSWSVYQHYAKACSTVGVIAVLLLQCSSQGAQVGSNIWLKYWSGKNLEEGTNRDIWLNLGIYAIIGWSSTIFAFSQTMIMWVFCGIRSARFLHNSMLNTVLRTPMSFFDTTPLGRILNRFSKDEHTIDEVLPRNFNMYVRVLAQVLATVLIITFSTPFFLILVIPLAFVYMGVQKYYLATSRELKRLDSVGKSPIYSHFQETIQGVSTIRAYEQQRVFIYQNQHKLDTNQRTYFPSISCNRWLAVRLEFLGSVIIFGSSLFAVFGVLYGSKSYIDPGLVGLSVSYALSVTQALNWVIRSYCDIETNIVSVERVKEYIDLPRERYEATRTVDPMWPTKGHIEFNGYSTRYREGLDFCLRELSFTIAPKEKIGIVGRTGAGKSSLSLALFRIIEAAKGNILIDGIDISSLRLFDLRSRLTIIPQDPVLFAGTVRENLDPFGTHDDVEIWQALENAHLKEHVAAMEGQLNGVVIEGGDNFSVGQRQLICLARALLRHTTILILDEATAAIDVETDAIIQETIRKQFANCTILTIAHRINTVMDSDRILVLDKGMIAEFDSPKNLLTNKESQFYSLSKEAGLVD
ncbi:multi drug resistance-associated protein MRP [Cokeromyces recurvatus]|uniref:multi drug resistance-associated protein MRP n=1 Tax=Cokeromyces recurvatus TaxID=90255 RepID=UPI00221F7987|nr:multi drug resistance-associated protein MRP [Cokeromyces recurvatus]KAI7899459.1 multi drug resistance-associated protein MRP [Cokeromyces recurvatus]